MNRVREFLRAWRPSPGARKGALWAAALLVLPYWAYFGGELHVGLGPVLDWIVWLVGAVVLLFAGAVAIALAVTLVRRLPPFATGFLITAALMVGLPWPSPMFGAAITAAVALVGGAIGALIVSFAAMEGTKKALTIILFVLGIAAISGMIWFLAWDGTDDGLAKASPSKLPEGALLDAPDPSAPGTFSVKYLTYGTGTDRRRAEFGPQAAIKSRSVDGSKLLKDLEGWKGKYLKWYWGFDTKQMPLNARVWYPEGQGPFPLILIVHGNHSAQEWSDPGYEYLGKLFASRGYIFASIDENFINGGFPAGYDTKETAARGWLLLEHLKLWREWNSASNHQFQGKVDLSRIGLMGHSRGGEAVATASEFNRLKYFPGDANQRFDYGFNIQALIAISPVDGQYKPAGMTRNLKDVSYLTVQGSHDFDVSTFDGSKQFQRTSFSENSNAFKAYLYIYRANHGQFNTVWGRYDWSPPGVWLMNLKPLLTGDEQRKIGQVYFSAFMDAVLKGRSEYLPLFEDARRGGKWLPATIYLNRYEDASFHPLSTFDEDYDVTTTTMPGGAIYGENLALWKEQRSPSRQSERDDNAVFLGWRKDEKSSYTLDLPRDLKLDSAAVFELASSAVDEDPPAKDESGKKDGKKKEEKKDADKKERKSIDFTVEFTGKDGSTKRVALSEMGPIYPPLTGKLVKTEIPGFDPYKKTSEPVLQRYSYALGDLAVGLQRIRLVFDRTPEGVVIVDDIGFSRRRQ